MKFASGVILCCLFFYTAFSQQIYHVSTSGNDLNKGSIKKPLKTINAAALLAHPGDTITVHQGIYRERISPPRGGLSNKRITYKAAYGERVYIKGSEVIKGWIKIKNDSWMVKIPNTFFGNYNPFKDTIHGDWFWDKGRRHHPGAVYLNGEWLWEAPSLDSIFEPATKHTYWFSSVDQDSTTIWAQFKQANPNTELVEINVRQTIFYPEKSGIDYITVSGFDMSQAATPWAPPTAEQIGLIGTHWSKGWIIENNKISYSRCVGITLGKYGDEFDNVDASASAYNATIERALKNGWNENTVGHHIVQNNEIYCCEQAGIVGSLGAIFSTITGNSVHDIWTQQLFDGAEMAGIKIHAAIDCEINNNHIYNNGRGLWLDWMAQGTSVKSNFLHGNQEYDIYLEVDHGPILIENNILLSPISQRIWSQGVAYIHNIIGGNIEIRPLDRRQTPFLVPHSTELGGLHNNPSNDIRFYNNIFTGNCKLNVYDTIKPMWMSGNVFLNGAISCVQEEQALILSNFNPDINIIERNNKFYLNLKLDKAWATSQNRHVITSKILDTVSIARAAFEYPDRNSIKIDKDYFNSARNEQNPFPGPIELIDSIKNEYKVWPIK